MSDSSNAKRIAENTVILYIRMIILLGISLYTSRVLLEVLGVEDYGIYNIVGSIVVLFSFLSNSMMSATQRFIAFEIGRKDGNVSHIFRCSLALHVLLAAVFGVLSEAVGVPVLNKVLNIEASRMAAANWAFQFSLLVFLLQIIRVPFFALLIAYEKMGAYAFLNILEAVTKLAAVVALCHIHADKLILFSGLYFASQVLMLILFCLWCRKLFPQISFTMLFRKADILQLCSFSGWSMLGSFANILRQQVVNLLINVFCGVRINSAVGVAQQLSSTVFNFVAGFQTAFNPPLIKKYAEKEYKELFQLIAGASKYSFYLLYFFALPLLCTAPFVFGIWLKEVPQYTIEFCRWEIIGMFFDALSAPLWTTSQATGRIRGYQILMAAIIVANLPAAYLILFFHLPPVYIFVARVVFNALAFAARIVFLRGQVRLPVFFYLRKAVLPIFGVVALTLPLPLLCSSGEIGWGKFLLTGTVCALSVPAAVFFAGMNASERGFLKSYLVQKLTGICSRLKRV